MHIPKKTHKMSIQARKCERKNIPCIPFHADFFHTYMGRSTLPLHTRLEFATSQLALLFFRKINISLVELKTKTKAKNERKKELKITATHLCKRKKKRTKSERTENNSTLCCSRKIRNHLYLDEAHENARKWIDIECEEPEGKKIY